jgi:hypothetical protein
MGIGVPKRSKLGPGDSPEPETKRTVCRFFSSGMCEYGKDCRFLHVMPEVSPQPPRLILADPRSPRNSSKPLPKRIVSATFVMSCAMLT